MIAYKTHRRALLALLVAVSCHMQAQARSVVQKVTFDEDEKFLYFSSSNRGKGAENEVFRSYSIAGPKGAPGYQNYGLVKIAPKTTKKVPQASENLFIPPTSFPEQSLFTVKANPLVKGASPFERRLDPQHPHLHMWAIKHLLGAGNEQAGIVVH